MNTKTIEAEVARIRSNCEEVDSIIFTDKNLLEKEMEQIDNYKKAKLDEYSKKFEKILSGYKDFYNNVVEFGNIFIDDYIDVVKTYNKGSFNYFKEKTLDENREMMREFSNEFNSFINELEKIDFDSIDKPHKFVKKGKTIIDANDESFNPIEAEGDSVSYERKRVLTEFVIRYLGFEDKVEHLVETICSQIEEIMSSRNYSHELDMISNKYSSIRNKEIEDKNADVFNTYFVDENQKATKKDFFEDIDKCREESDVSMENGSNEFKEKISIGELKVNVSSKHASYFNRGETYKKYIKGGYMYVPLLWDFVDDGNILIETNCESYSDNVINFVRQLILEFVSAFPAKRTRIKLIDLDNKMDFSVLSRLANSDRDILDGGIVRTESELTPTIQNFNNLIFKVKDDLLSYNMVKNIFEFNKQFKANPQSVYLFVFANFPYCLRDDSIKKVYDIVNNGNESGVFSIIISNETYLNSNHQGLSIENYEKTLKMIEDKSIIIREDGVELKYISNLENVFVPRSDFRIEDIQTIIERLKDNAKKSTQIIISTDEMFEYTDNDKDDDPAAIKLNIPIGKRGGDVQILSLDASSTNTHALAIGSTGSGKSVLLHTIILNACYKYSPEDLNLYIIDFKGGVEFKYYESKEDPSLRLPHIRLTGLTSDVEDGLAILKNIESILSERESVFTSVGCQNIYEYCKKVKTLPRILVIIDEIQTLFDENENIAYKAIKIIDKILTKGRAFGICILWASQGVPRTPGSNKLLSETGNKICLKLQNPQDAAAINVDPRMVGQLGQIEKGLGVFNDTPIQANSRSFRVAYSESAENRVKYSKMIIDKWKNVTNSVEFDPLFVVGDDAQPTSYKRVPLYNLTPSADRVKSFAYGQYDIIIGENYVTGKPYVSPISIRENLENMLVVGNQIETVRDIMGYSLLSLISNHMINEEAIHDNTKIYYVNGELIDPTNENSLLNLIRNDFEDKLIVSNNNEKIISMTKDIYKIYKNRYKESSESEYAIKYPPIFIFIHSIQRYFELFEENPMLKFDDNKSETPQVADTSSLEDMFSNIAAFKEKSGSNDNTSSSKSNNELKNIYFVEALAELMDRGGSYGIHFIVSGNKPTELKKMKESFRKFEYKVITKGLKNEYISELISDYRNADSFNKLNVCWVNYKDNKDKVKYYQFNYENDKAWYESIKAKLLNNE